MIFITKQGIMNDYWGYFEYMVMTTEPIGIKMVLSTLVLFQGLWLSLIRKGKVKIHKIKLPKGRL